MSNRTAVVTGASSGIGAATARRLAVEGFHVVCVARRTDRIEKLAQEIGGTAVTCDITSDDDVARLAEAVGDRLDVLVNNAGGAFGLEPVAEADLASWSRMFELNVVGTTRVTKALLPALIAAEGVAVFVTSTAAEGAYAGGAGYCGAKSAEKFVKDALRVELVDKPVRFCEVAPGMVQTEEFSLTRFDGDEQRADAVYEGVVAPLVADDVADVIAFVATRPSHVNIDSVVVRPRAQANQQTVHRSL
ncbi:MAG: SDR family oxidoreductase [Propionibacteriaceae bacterium]|nr:SDR family oxidoreductase [Propionibacteriaceae bacterium]